MVHDRPFISPGRHQPRPAPTRLSTVLGYHGEWTLDPEGQVYAFVAGGT
jgi:hypothetical protein